MRKAGVSGRGLQGGLGRRLKRLKRQWPREVRLVSDSAALRWFPPLRAVWAPVGKQASVVITEAMPSGQGAIYPRTGGRIVLVTRRGRQEDFKAFLRALRTAYPGRPLLLLDRANCHSAQSSQWLATHR